LLASIAKLEYGQEMDKDRRERERGVMARVKGCGVFEGKRKGL
jgi:hypothetical protein